MAADMFKLKCSDDYAVVCMDHFMMVIKGEPWSLDFAQFSIWAYKLYTEEWRKYGELACSKARKPGTSLCLESTCAVALGADVYLFGGKDFRILATKYFTNSMLKLDKQPNGPFEWSEVTVRNGKVPSPRCGHTGWTFGKKTLGIWWRWNIRNWIFG